MSVDQIIPNRTYENSAGGRFRVDCVYIPRQDQPEHCKAYVTPIMSDGRAAATVVFILEAFAAIVVRQV